MNWKKEAVNDLKNYIPRLAAMQNLKDRIRTLEEKYESTRGVSNEVPVMGGGNRTEDSMINNIVERERLNKNLKAVSGLLELTQKGLNCLDERQHKVLHGFYIERPTDYIERLCDELHVEQSTLYRIKDEALYRFTIGMYGIIDL